MKLMQHWHLKLISIQLAIMFQESIIREYILNESKK